MSGSLGSILREKGVQSAVCSWVRYSCMPLLHEEGRARKKLSTCPGQVGPRCGGGGTWRDMGQLGGWGRLVGFYTRGPVQWVAMEIHCIDQPCLYRPDYSFPSMPLLRELGFDMADATRPFRALR